MQRHTRRRAVLNRESPSARCAAAAPRLSRTAGASRARAPAPGADGGVRAPDPHRCRAAPGGQTPGAAAGARAARQAALDTPRRGATPSRPVVRVRFEQSTRTPRIIRCASGCRAPFRCASDQAGKDDKRVGDGISGDRISGEEPGRPPAYCRSPRGCALPSQKHSCNQEQNYCEHCIQC